jgi:hypothetical protein
MPDSAAFVARAVKFNDAREQEQCRGTLRVGFTPRGFRRTNTFLGRGIDPIGPLFEYGKTLLP